MTERLARPRVIAHLLVAIVALQGSVMFAQNVVMYRGMNPQRMIEVPGPGQAAMSVAFSEEGSLLFVGYDDGKIRRFDLICGNPPVEIEASVHRVPIHSLAVNSVSSLLAVASPEPEAPRAGLEAKTAGLGDLVTILDVSGRVVHKLSQRMPGRVIALAFSGDGKRLAAIDSQSIVRGWNVGDGIEIVNSELYKSEGRKSSFPQSRAAFSSDLNRAVILNDDVALKVEGARWDHIVKLWDLSRDEPRYFTRPFGEEVNSVTISPDGSRFVTTDELNFMFINEFSSLKMIAASMSNAPLELEAGARRPRFLSISRDNRRLVEGAEAGFSSVEKLDVKVGSAHYLFEGPRGYVRASVFLRDGARIASGGWEALQGQKIEGTGQQKYEPLIIWDVKVDNM